MTKCILLMLALLLTAPLVHAQQPSTAPSSRELQLCLLGTESGTWAALKLTPDQFQRMKFIQEACTEECKAAAATGNPDTISHSNGETVMGEVRNVLDAAQYRAWVAYCAGNAIPAK